MKKKSEIVWGINYDLKNFEKEFINAANRYIKSRKQWVNFSNEWDRALSLYFAVYESLNGKYPDYTCEFMQLVAMCEIKEYLFICDFFLEGEDSDSYYKRRLAEIGN